jgi:hypothetical protein
MTPDELAEKTLHRRGVEAAIWGMPIVSFDAMRRGFFGVGAQYGDIVYFSRPADWRFQLTTPNSSSLYVYFNFNLKAGPIVIDVPPAVGAGLFGSILDAWQAPMADVGPEGEDQGAGARYLLAPPDYKEEAPAGFIVLPFATFNGYAAFRAIPKTRLGEDTTRALALVKQLRVYALSREENPPEQRHIDIAGQLFEGIAPFDDTFYDRLAAMVNEEPVQTRDMGLMGQLRSIGIEKGREFKPDIAARAILREAIAEAHAGFMDAMVGHVEPYWPNRRWGVPPFVQTGARTAFTYQTESSLDIDQRGAMFFDACAPPRRLGAATLYLLAAVDAEGAPFDGGKTYRLRVPPGVPARQFWAVTVYDLETAAFIRESPKTEINSYQETRKESDGSIHIFFGPEAPAGKEANWIYTEPGARWHAAFRFYGPESAIRDRSWTLDDIDPVK